MQANDEEENKENKANKANNENQRRYFDDLYYRNKMKRKSAEDDFNKYTAFETHGATVDWKSVYFSTFKKQRIEAEFEAAFEEEDLTLNNQDRLSK